MQVLGPIWKKKLKGVWVQVWFGQLYWCFQVLLVKIYILGLIGSALKLKYLNRFRNKNTWLGLGNKNTKFERLKWCFQNRLN